MCPYGRNVNIEEVRTRASKNENPIRGKTQAHNFTIHPKQTKSRKNKHTMPNNIKSFSVAQVSKWLEELGTPNTSFIQNKIDGSALETLPTRVYQRLRLDNIRRCTTAKRIGSDQVFVASRTNDSDARIPSTRK
jgi:hypothetical protein